MSTDVPQASENGGSDEETPNECESDGQTSECSYSDGELMPAYDEADALAEALLGDGGAAPGETQVHRKGGGLRGAAREQPRSPGEQ